MKRLIFLNLLIDRFWGRESILDHVFNVSNPESLRLSLISFNLAINYKDNKSDINKDFYILSLNPDSYWLSQFAVFHQLDKMSYQVIHKDPYIIADWLEEFNSKTSGFKFNDYAISGVSDLESDLIQRQLKLSLDDSLVKKQKLMNSKQFLLRMAAEQAIPVPESQIILGKNIIFSGQDSDGKIFKFDLSSGGAGQFNFEKLNLIFNWAESRGLRKYWDASVWICQKKISIQNEWSVFSHTDSDDFCVSKIKYDSNLLSNRHYFDKSLQLNPLLKDIYSRIKKSLIENNYLGYFGFDVISDFDNELFVVDLNLRLTKTHLLQMALSKWKCKYPVCVFYRKRFLLNKKVNFNEFWVEFCSLMKVNELGEGSDYRILPFDIFGFSQGKSEITFLIDCDSEKTAESFLLKIDEFIKEVA